MADVFVLASPAPVLYVYPAQVHPAVPSTPTPGGGRIRWVSPRRPIPTRRHVRDDDETALAVLGAI